MTNVSGGAKGKAKRAMPTLGARNANMKRKGVGVSRVSDLSEADKAASICMMRAPLMPLDSNGLIVAAGAIPGKIDRSALSTGLWPSDDDNFAPDYRSWLLELGAKSGLLVRPYLVGDDDKVVVGKGEVVCFRGPKTSTDVNTSTDTNASPDEKHHGSSDDDQRRLALLKAAASSDYVPADSIARAASGVQADTIQILGGPEVLGRAITSDEDVVEAIATGLPAGVLNALRETGLPPSALEQVIAPKRTLMRRKSDEQRLTRGESDAAWRLARAVALASSVLDGRKAAIAWLSRPKQLLQGRTAFDLLETSVGTAYVHRLLHQLEWGNAA